MSYKYAPSQQSAGFCKEATFGNGAAALTTLYAFDARNGLEPSVPIEEWEQVFRNGSPVPTDELSKGIPPVEFTPEFDAQTGIWWYYALGVCTTVGTDTSVTARTITYAGTGKIVTLSGTALVASAHIGSYLVITAGDQSGHYWLITANDTSTVTLQETDSNLPTALDGDTAKIVTAPYTHTITMRTASTRLPSFAMHVELENTTDAQSRRFDIFGCFLKKMSIEGKKGECWKNKPAINVSNYGTGSDIARVTDLTDKVYKWEDMEALTFTYNSAAVQANIEQSIDSFSCEFGWDLETITGGGQKSANDLLHGKAETNIKFHYYPQNKTLQGLRRTAFSDYAGTLTMTHKILRADGGYIQWVWNYLKVKPAAEEKLPTIEDRELGEDVELEFGPRAAGDESLIVTVVDNLGYLYYEQGTE